MLKLINAEPGKEYHEEAPIGKPSPDSRMPLEFAETIPKQMVEAGIKAVEITGGGEPTLWPAFDTLIENLGKADREIGLVTNGSNLSSHRIALICKYCLWIRISMDSSNTIIHKRIHRTPNRDFERRLAHIRDIAKKKRPDLVLGISFIVTPDNIDDVEDAVDLYSRIHGVNHIRFSWMYDREGHAGLTDYQIRTIRAEIEIYQEGYNREDFKIFCETDRVDLYSRPNNDFEKCHFQRFVWAVGADCNVYPCCIMKYHPDYANGNLKENTLLQLIQDANVHAKMNKLDVTKCFPCWLRHRNQSIASAVDKPVHHNFI